jgi:alkaline phosphatase D
MKNPNKFTYLLLCLYTLVFPSESAQAQKKNVSTQKQNLDKAQIKCGPMVGQVQLRDAIIWVQTNQKSHVIVEYYYKDSSGQQIVQLSAKEITREPYFIGTIYLTDLRPDTEYSYKILLDEREQNIPYSCTFKTQSHWQFRKEPPTFSFVAGSCNYVNDPNFDRPGKGYGSNYQIFNRIDSMRPDFMLWLGDNTYLREGDFESQDGIYDRQSHTRSLTELRPLMAHTPNYAIWDDHDYGTNDANRTYRLKNHSLNAFKEFWPSEYYRTNHLEGITHSFAFNDCEFFMLDNRWDRTADTSGTILGKNQIDWLKDALLSSNGSYKFVAVGGQFLSDFKGYENFANFARERKEIIDFIDKHKIKNVIFLTGDRHHSEVTKVVTSGGTAIYDITSSALTSSTYDHSKEPNTLRVPESIFGVNNFAVLTVKGERKNRKLSLRFVGADGRELYNYEF